MNNTRYLLLITIIAATLVLGTNVIPMQSYADRGDNDDRKKDNDYKSKTSASYESDKKSSKQNQDQDNFCYRSDDCEQANQGQQLAGKDNEAKGFNDQSDNLSVEITADNGTGTDNGNNIPPCIACFFDNLDEAQDEALNEALDRGFTFEGVIYTSVEQICLAIQAGTLSLDDITTLLTDLLPGGEEGGNVRAVVACLNLIFNN